MEKTPRVSVVIPAFNAGKTLGRALDSCLGQTLSQLEIIVVDDCSDDNTSLVARQVANAHPDRVRVFRNERNLQCLESRRVGCRKARGSYIAFLDADDELPATYCEDLSRLAADSDADIVTTSILPCRDADGPTGTNDQAIIAAFSVPDVVLRDEEVVHATYRSGSAEDSIPWNLCGKLFRKTLVDKAESSLPHTSVFHGEDALFYFVLSAHAGKLISSTNLPAYRYYIDSGCTHSTALVGCDRYSLVCQGSIAAEGVFAFLTASDMYEKYRLDYESMRRRLLLDPANRFPDTVKPKERPAAFDAFLGSWPAAEAIGGLAELHWQDASLVVHASLGSRSLQSRRGATRTVAICCQDLDDGDAGLAMRGLADTLRSGGYNVVLVLDEGTGAPELPGNIRIERIPGYSGSIGSRYGSRAERLYEALSRHMVDTLIHCQWIAEALPWDLMVAKSLGIRCIVHTSGAFYTPYTRKLPSLLSNAQGCGLADSVVCLSGVDAAWWRRFVPRVHVDEKPFELACLADGPHASAGKTVAWCGRVENEEGPLDAIYALRELLKYEPEAHLMMYGPCTNQMREALMNEARSAGVESSLKICGPRTEGDLIGEYRRADAFLLSSHLEGWPLALAKAKAAGLPCVMYDKPCLALCRPGTGVLTACAGNADGLGRQLAHVLGDKSARLRLANEALAQAREIAAFDRESFWDSVIAELDYLPEVQPQPEDLDEERMWRCLFTEMQRQTNSANDECERGKAALIAKDAEIEAIHAELEAARSERARAGGLTPRHVFDAPLRRGGGRGARE